MSKPGKQTTSSEAINAPEAFLEISSFHEAPLPEGQTELFLAVCKFCEEVERECAGKPSVPRWLTLSGRPGCGKTHLAKEVLKWALRYHEARPLVEPPMFMPSRARRDVLFGGCRETYDIFNGSKAHAIDRHIDDLSSVWLLILDDFGFERLSSDQQSHYWYRLLDARMGKWTLMTTNLAARQIAKFDERIRSRMWRDRNVLLESGAIDWYMPKDDSL
ncbi:MAG: hypothetical protein Q7Q73_07395 [Verrucomicrobiota bacterium JB024]|nr:hypothetical protein [Verrucomicrobiota bacterium JB024]